MIQLVLPSETIGPLGWEFLSKSLQCKDKYITNALKQMIGFVVTDASEKGYYVGDLTEDKQLQYYYNGAYETKAILSNSVIFYSRQELIDILKDLYNIYTNKTLKIDI